jgi:hypothetical protein
MPGKRGLFLILAVIIAFPRGTLAASGTEGASFLDIPVGAGPAALGSAYSALATDAYAPVWNPAGLGFVDSTQVAAQHLSYLDSIYYEYLGTAIKINTGNSIGVSAQYLGSGNIPGAALDGTPQPDYTSHFAAYSLAYGHELWDRLSVGLTGKVLDAAISDVNSHAYAADFGALYKPAEKIQLAATVTNIGNKLSFLNDDSSLPLTGRLGAAYEPTRHWLLAAEGDYAKTGLLSGHFGIQWRPIEMISIRAGYKTDTTQELGAMAGLTAGLGLTFWGQEFSYAWVPYGDLGDTQYFSLLLKFGQAQESKKNLVQYQNIKRGRGAKATDPEYQQLLELLKSGDEYTAQKSGTPAQEPMR